MNSIGLRLTLGLATALVCGPALAAEQAAKDIEIRDHTNISLQEYGIEAVTPAKDPVTGFVVGGKNPTEKISGLTQINGIAITELEKTMRPGESSSVGFLGPKESLLEIMAADNRYVVDESKLTHQELARHLHAMGAIWQLQSRSGEQGATFLYHGRRLRVTGRPSRGFQPSPFNDGTKSGTDVTVENLDTGRKLSYGLLVPFMVERYGFYEGKGTPYRLNPRDVVQVFDFLKPE